ncbi:ABC transporter ATP-binding protein [Alkaliphilus oremlandii]|uniref:ABC transporter related n=1 Tax=Alkaliphilus oremlandii (strain OhILAs) TaxID=350688 RepID=A8MM97_ALKOO|nr:ABC transporter ATP-binding protein [Alkaliphilus oremlandii]ABW18264.1 ABC transporter related [Alkaliphilus oremlandii OhILAs]
MNLLEIQNLSGGYDKVKILHGLSFQIKAGEILGLIGPNGAGKTTIIKSILGILPPMDGEIKMLQYNIKEDSLEFKKRIAYIPEVPLLYDEMTLLEHLEFVAMSHGIHRKVFEERIHKLLEIFRLSNKLHHFPNSFSKGMKQKVMILCAFLYDPSVYIVDEPFVGLDPKATKDFIDLIKRKREENKGILMCTHVLDTAEKICDRFILISSGQIEATGTLEELREYAGMKEGSLGDIYDRLVRDGE